MAEHLNVTFMKLINLLEETIGLLNTESSWFCMEHLCILDPNYYVLRANLLSSMPTIT